MRNTFTAFILLTITATNLSWADELPRTAKTLVIETKDGEGKKADRQYCYSRFTIDENGNWTAWTKFSNGKNWDGDHFQAILTVKDKKGNSCLAINQVAGVKAEKFCSGSCEREVNHSGTSVINSHDLTNEYSYQCTGWDETDDLLMATGAAAFIACSAAGVGEACSTTLATSLPKTGQEPKEPATGCAP